MGWIQRRQVPPDRRPGCGPGYDRDMGPTPDSTDSGAYVDIGWAGSPDLVSRVHSSLAGRRSLWTGQRLESTAFGDHRAYAAYTLLGGQVHLGGDYQYRVEAWGGDSHPEYDTLDLRLWYNRRSVASWVRLHASWSWDSGNRALGASCPWNPAVNTAVDGTADSVWDGGCTRGRLGETGRVIGAWVTGRGGTLPVGTQLGHLQPRVSIRNWAYAHGPYRVTWENLVVSGMPAATAAMASGSGRLVPIGKSSDLRWIPRGDTAAFSFLAVSRGEGRPGGAQLHYRAPNLELVSAGSDWVLAEPHGVSFAGEATVNGASGYRYEWRVTRGEAPEAEDRLSIRIWSPSESVDSPGYLAFGTLSRGTINLRLPPEASLPDPPSE